MSSDEDEPCNECIRVDKWDGCAVKNALDDAVKNILIEKYKTVESHRLMDIRLGICFTSVGAAMFALLWDYLHPFPQSKPILIACVASYFVLMGVLTFYTMYIERGIFVEAYQDNNKWTISSDMKRFEDEYTLSVEYSVGGTTNEAKLSKSASKWFTEEGDLINSKFEAEVSRLIESLKKDKKNK